MKKHMYIYTYICVCMYVCVCVCVYIYIYIYIDIKTEQNYKRNTFVFAPIFHELNLKILDFFYEQKVYFSQILFTNLSKSVLVNEIIIHLTGVSYQDAD